LSEENIARGQGFYSSIGAYSNLELDLLLKNLIQHIEDNKKAGGEFTISAFTKPIDKRLKHIEGTGDRVRFVIYPKSEHIKWAAPTDVYSGSVWDAHEKVSKDKKSELLGVSFTKAPSLRNIANRVISNQMGSTGLQSRTKISIKEKFPNSKMNLILVVAESLRRDHLSLYGYSRDTTPFLKKYAKEKNQEFVVFQNAYSNASSTLISLPSILTGVSPIQSAADTHSYPLFWEYGKESGKKTFYITSHSLAWNNLGGYFANGGIDYQFNRENSNEPIFNDIGIDDRKTLAAFDKHIRKLSEENKNFSGLLHLNTNHFPFFVPSSSKVWQGNDVKDMYDNSVYHFDKLIESMFQTLKDTNNLENTIVIITSDHGESLLEHNYLGHIESYYLETVSIPMMVYFPKKLQTYDTFHNLQSNANKNVMNLDIIPTIVHLLNKSLDSFHTVSFVGFIGLA